MSNPDDEKDQDTPDEVPAVEEDADRPTGRRSTPWLAAERRVLEDTPEELFAAGVMVKTGFGSVVAGRFPNNLCNACNLYFDDDIFERCPLCVAINARRVRDNELRWRLERTAGPQH